MYIVIMNIVTSLNGKRGLSKTITMYIPHLDIMQHKGLCESVVFNRYGTFEYNVGYFVKILHVDLTNKKGFSTIITFVSPKVGNLETRSFLSS
jgi:hypothetical protein